MGRRKKASSSRGEASRTANPFDAIKARSKHSIIGRNPQGTQKQITKAKTKAIEQRKRSLLVEYQAAGRKNAFVDRRFGEGDQTITAEDKALHRFQKERLQVCASPPLAQRSLG